MKIGKISTYCFFIPLTLSPIFVNAVGKIYIFELFAIGVFAGSFLAGRKFLKTELFFLFFGVLLLIRILLSNDVLLSSNIDWFGTFLLMLLFLMGLIAYSKYQWSRVFRIYAGASLGLALSIVAFGNDASWISQKPLLERAVSFVHVPLFILALISFGRSRVIAMLLITAALCVALMNSDRGQAVVYLAALSGVFAQILLRAKVPKKHRPLHEYFSIVVGICVAAVVAGEGLVLGAKYEVFNERFSAKILSQAEHEYGFLAGARPDQVPMIEAVMERPITGYGANGPDQSWSVKMLLLDPEVQQLKGERLEAHLERGLVLHSGILGAWVRYGILGGVFWGIIIAFSIKVLRDYLAVTGWQSVLVVACATDLIFQGLFEPGRLRFDIALNLMVVFTALRYHLPVPVASRKILRPITASPIRDAVRL
ncbi:MAG: hypothetical protein NXH72_14180 [Hyphomonadaceae bacterium]|nr:hypothetical protein [Hyphomonadaceae bacterium]